MGDEDLRDEQAADRLGLSSLWVVSPYELPRPDETPVIDLRYKRKGIAAYVGVACAVLYLELNGIGPEQWDEFIYVARWIFCFAMFIGLVSIMALLVSSARRQDRIFYIDKSKTKTRFFLRRLFDASIFAVGWLLAQVVLALVHVGS